ncbi:MAG: ATP-binding protein, partial [Planctomycetota bacterium]
AAVELARAQNDLATLGEDLHDLSRRLHPAVLDDLGLSAALRSECNRRSSLTGLSIQFEDSATEACVDSLSGDLKLALFRIAQEALTNAIRHAQPTSIEVKLDSDERRIRMTITDDGIGFDTRGVRGPGIGLSSMDERIRLVDGRLSVTSRPSRGTEVEALVSVPNGEEADGPAILDPELVPRTTESGH